MAGVNMPSENAINITNFIKNRNVTDCGLERRKLAKGLISTAKNLFRKDLYKHYGCVNAVEFSNDGNLLFSGGDDLKVLMWDVNQALVQHTGKLGGKVKPLCMKGHHLSNIFCLSIDDEHKRVLSGGNDRRVMVNDYVIGTNIMAILCQWPIFSLSISGHMLACNGESGGIILHDIRTFSLAGHVGVPKINIGSRGVMFHPEDGNVLASANSEFGVHLFDIRKPNTIMTELCKEPSMSVRWNTRGDKLLALRNLRPMILLDPLHPQLQLEFDSPCYLNACTLKSCSFVGDYDEYVASGSDDFNLYLWKIPDPWPESGCVETEHLALTGHRSIVNHVRYSASKQLLASCGVEKMFKIWSPLRLPFSTGNRDKPCLQRARYLCSHIKCQRVRSPSPRGQLDSINEDKPMIHFFDNLLREELNEMPSGITSYSRKIYIQKKKRHVLQEMINSDPGVCTVNSIPGLSSYPINNTGTIMSYVRTRPSCSLDSRSFLTRLLSGLRFRYQLRRDSSSEDDPMVMSESEEEGRGSRESQEEENDTEDDLLQDLTRPHSGLHFRYQLRRDSSSEDDPMVMSESEEEGRGSRESQEEKNDTEDDLLQEDPFL